MSFSITPSMVKSFRISDECDERYPCGHYCQITLSDGRTKDWRLAGDKISALIKKIDKDNVEGDSDHFTEYSNFEGLPFSDKAEVSSPIPEEILSQIFKK